MSSFIYLAHICYVLNAHYAQKVGNTLMIQMAMGPALTKIAVKGTLIEHLLQSENCANPFTSLAD